MATPKIIIQKATAFQLNPDKAYIIHLPQCTKEESDQLRAWLKERGIEQVIIAITETMEITEVEKK